MSKRKEYSSPYRSLEAIWTVLRTHATREHPLSVRDIEAQLKRLEDAPSRDTVGRLLPRESGLMETLYPGVLQESGRPGAVGAYLDGGALHVVVETPEGEVLAQGGGVEYTVEPFRAPSYSTVDNILKSGVLFELRTFPFRLRCVANAAGKGKPPRYIPYDRWEDSLTPEQAAKNNAPRYYYLANVLSPGEWRIFTDLVQVYPYITERQTGRFLSVLNHLKGRRTPPAPSRYAFKRGSDAMFRHIGLLDAAIRGRKRVEVRYGEYRLVNRDGQWTPELLERERNGVLTVEPYALMWSNGNYYLVCKHRGMMNLRVDRILEVVPLGETFDWDETFEPALYRDKCPVMYPGESEFIHLRCKTEMLNILIDFFGTLPQYAAPDEAGFMEVTMSIAPSGVKLFALQYADGVEVIAPEHLRREIRDTLTQAAAAYSGTR